MERLRVIQWTTGKVGTQALRAIIDDPRLELVGLFAHSPDKVGLDAGTLCGRPATGVKATGDVATLVGSGADAVLYTPFMADLDHVTALLGAGINVVSTNLFLNCGGVDGATRERLDAACRQGGSSLLITGVNPGWANALAASLTAVCREVRAIAIYESADVSNYTSRETWEAMGMGRFGADDTVTAMARMATASFRDAAQRIADSIGLELETLDFAIEFAPTTRSVDLGFMVLPEGSNGALRSAWIGTIAGVEVIRVSVAWHLTRELGADWLFGDDHYHIIVRGEPDVETRVRFVAPQWQGSDWSILTALPAVNAVPAVVAAAPGILALADMPLVAGQWQRR